MLCSSYVFWGAACTTGAQPANDSFANRISIEGSSADLSGSLAGATSEAGEPLIPDVSSGQTAWWTWTAPANGIVTLSTSGTGFNPFLAVYWGNNLNQLALVASNNFLACYETEFCGCRWRVRNQTTFHVQQGISYHLALDSALWSDSAWFPNTPDNSFRDVFYSTGLWLLVRTTNLLAGGALQLGLRFTAAPRNDDFENRIALAGSRKHLTVSNEGATAQPGEPAPFGNAGGSSVWYSWTAPAGGRVTLSASEIPPYSPPSWWGSYSSVWAGFSLVPGPPPSCGREIDQSPLPEFSPVFSAYTGATLASLIPANCLPVALEAFPHAVEFDVTKGQTYQIAVDGNGGSTGRTPLYLRLTRPASNDDFKRRIRTHGIRVISSGFNAGATREPGEPTIPDSSGKTVWWSWTAPVSGMVAVALTGDRPFPVTVFTGSEVANLQGIAVTNETFQAEAGQVYQIAVSDDAGQTGEFKLHLTAPLVELPLLQAYRSGAGNALLRYTGCSSGQVIMLQRWSTKGADHWATVRATAARGNTVDFSARPAPTSAVPYRAIVVDYVRR